MTHLYILLALQALDLVTTYLALKDGRNREANPIIAGTIRKLGLVPGLLLAKFFAVGITIWASQVLSPLVLFAFIGFYVYVILRNLRIANDTRKYS